MNPASCLVLSSSQAKYLNEINHVEVLRIQFVFNTLLLSWFFILIHKDFGLRIVSCAQKP